MTYHQEWYSQRYGSSFQEKRGEKSNYYVEMNAARKSQKETNVSNAELVFSEHQIPYEVRGASWYCSIGGEAYYFYPTSGKWRPQGKTTVYRSRGASDFIGKVLNWQRS